MATDTKETVRGIELRSDFPSRRNSPDPVEVIEALVDTGTWVDAARVADCGESTLRVWRDKYPEIQEAYLKGKDKLGYDAEQTMACLARGTLPDTAHEEVQVPAPGTMLKAAKKMASINHPDKDYTQTNRVIRAQEEVDEDMEKELEDMDEDDLLDELNKRVGGDE